MRTRFFQLPGVGFPMIGLQTGQAYGIEVDNSSGSWLFIPSLDTYVPPFTIGWSLDFPYGVSSLDIIAGQPGPAGQVSTAQGSGVTVYLTDVQVGGSTGSPDTTTPGSPYAGTAFIEGFTPVLGEVILLGTSVSTSFPGTFIAAIPDKRIRLLTLLAGYNMSQGSPTPCLSPVRFNFSSTPFTLILMSIFPTLPIVPLVFPNGLDLEVGEPFNYDISTAWADENVSAVATYQVI